MSNLFKKFESDVEKERDGVPVFIEDSVIWVRRAGGNNRAYRYAMAVAARPYAEQLRGEVGPELFNIQEAILQQTFADCVVVRWENVDDRNGDPMDCTPENFLDLVRSCPSVWDAIKEAAVDDSQFRVAAEDGELLGKPLSGNLNGGRVEKTSSDSQQEASTSKH